MGQPQGHQRRGERWGGFLAVPLSRRSSWVPSRKPLWALQPPWRGAGPLHLWCPGPCLPAILARGALPYALARAAGGGAWRDLAAWGGSQRSAAAARPQGQMCLGANPGAQDQEQLPGQRAEASPQGDRLGWPPSAAQTGALTISGHKPWARQLGQATCRWAGCSRPCPARLLPTWKSRARASASRLEVRASLQVFNSGTGQLSGLQAWSSAAARRGLGRQARAVQGRRLRVAVPSPPSLLRNHTRSLRGVRVQTSAVLRKQEAAATLLGWGGSSLASGWELAGRGVGWRAGGQDGTAARARAERARLSMSKAPLSSFSH